MAGLLRLGAYVVPRDDLLRAAQLTRAAEELGYESAWVTHGLGRDAFVVLSAYGQITRRIGLGTGVVPIYPRHPVAMAQEAHTLAELTGGRLLLGVGVSHRPSMTDALGLPMGRPLAAMREYVTVLRDALAGRAVFAGSYYRVAWEGAFRARAAPPILVAALSPAMLELAGEIADGAVLWLCSPEYVRGVAIPALTRGRTRAGRPWTGFEVVAAVPLAVAPSGWTTFRQELVRYLELPFYRAMLRASGFEADISAFDRDAARRPKAEAIPRRLVEALGMVGDPALLRAYVERYRAAGVTLPAVRPIGGADAEDARQVLEAAAP